MYSANPNVSSNPHPQSWFAHRYLAHSGLTSDGTFSANWTVEVALGYSRGVRSAVSYSGAIGLIFDVRGKTMFASESKKDSDSGLDLEVIIVIVVLLTICVPFWRGKCAKEVSAKNKYIQIADEDATSTEPVSPSSFNNTRVYSSNSTCYGSF